ncbi:MAG: hypothetical protein ACT4O1_02140 [Gemmatimonadota bacterium]
MKRHWVCALATLAALPCVAQAQGDPGWGPVLRVTPWIGVSPGFTQEGFATVFTGGGVGGREYELEYGSSISFGANAEYRFWQRFSAIGGVVWSSRGKGDLLDFEDEIAYATDGATLWMVKAGLALRLREVRPDVQLRRLNASITAAPVFIHDVPKTNPLTPAGGDEVADHWGLNLGAEAELPLTGGRLAFQVGFEDYIIIWDETNFNPRVAGYIRTQNADAAVAIEPDNSHLVMFRVGLSWRF